MLWCALPTSADFETIWLWYENQIHANTESNEHFVYLQN